LMLDWHQGRFGNFSQRPVGRSKILRFIVEQAYLIMDDVDNG
jgi:hypothetical protein